MARVDYWMAANCFPLMPRRGPKMSYLAVKHHVVAEQQFSATLSRSATGLVGCVSHDIERVRQRGHAATFVTLESQALSSLPSITNSSAACKRKAGCQH